MLNNIQDTSQILKLKFFLVFAMLFSKNKKIYVFKEFYEYWLEVREKESVKSAKDA